MTNNRKTIAIAFLAALGAAPALAGNIPSPVGEWQTTTGESRYRVEMCGDGTDLCATLTWLREDARTAENLAYLNKTVVQAKKTTPAKWKGELVYQSETYAGTVTIINSNTLRLVGCVGPACESLVFNRI